jgi:hypothetical protein
MPTTQSVDNMLNELDAQAGVGGVPNTWMETPEQGNAYIPPAQRSGKAVLLPSSPNV